MAFPAWQYDGLRHSGVDYGDRPRRRYTRSATSGFAITAKIRRRSWDGWVLNRGMPSSTWAPERAPLRCTPRRSARRSWPRMFRARCWIAAAKSRSAECAEYRLPAGRFPHLPTRRGSGGFRHLHRRAASFPGFLEILWAAAVEPDSEIRRPVLSFRYCLPRGGFGNRRGIGDLIHSMREKVGAEFSAETVTHIRDEHSTYDWIMEGLLTRAGFRIDRAEYGSGFAAMYLCTNANRNPAGPWRFSFRPGG